MSTKAFTLIELLIVVAIIAILAAIAVPNFLEAQTRSKVSRVKNDLRAMATGMESYMIDNNTYPDDTFATKSSPGSLEYSRRTLPKLSTPVAYMSNGVLTDPFANKKPNTNEAAFYGLVNVVDANNRGLLSQALTSDQIGKLVSKHSWSLASVGPDGKYFVYGNNADTVDGPSLRSGLLTVIGETAPDPGFIYDATNGTTSRGDVLRTSSNQF